MKDYATRLRAAQSEPPAHAPNAALMIDFDNVTLGIRSDLQNQLRRLLNSEIIKGKVAVQRAYADWRRYPQYIVPLSEASIDLIFAPAFGSNKKNATDIRLAIDALEIVFTRPEIGTFILLSGDSDFSSLVLKLKEYGKYVIGVGIRESSSDLLVQNCDEYFSYSELTGLTKTRDMTPVHRDPWELVVDAVRRMKQDDDVMRSDRLKQVMQELDPNFNEKDAGFNRFSKFVLEASQRGLLSLNKMENGQYAVDLGSNANVPPGEEVDSGAADTATRSRRRRPPRRRGGPDAGQGLTLAEAFELLRQALLVLGAVGAEAAEADDVRTKMVELFGEDGDAVFERPRFQRLLRQAHDADLIELIKQDDDVYLLRLGPEALAEAGLAPSAAAPAEAGTPMPREAPAEPAEDPEPAPRRRGGRGGARGAKSRKRSTRTRKSDTKADAAGDSAETEPEPRRGPPAAGTAQPKGSERRQNPRYRRGSRGGSAEPAPTSEAAAETRAASAVQAQPTAVASARGVGPRRGSRGASRTPSPAAPSRDSAATPARGGVAPPDVSPDTTSRTAPVSDPRQEALAEPPPTGGGGLLKRMTAALQKVVKGADVEDADR